MGAELQVNTPDNGVGVEGAAAKVGDEVGADVSPVIPKPSPPDESVADEPGTAEAEKKSDSDGSPSSDVKKLRAEAKQRRLENEKLRAELAEVRAGQVEARRIVAAHDAGLPKGAHRFVSGDTEEELAESVAALQEFLVSVSSSAGPVDLGQTGTADVTLTKDAALRAMLTQQ